MSELKKKLEDNETDTSATSQSFNHWTDDVEMLPGSRSDEGNTMYEDGHQRNHQTVALGQSANVYGFDPNNGADVFQEQPGGRRLCFQSSQSYLGVGDSVTLKEEPVLKST